MDDVLEETGKLVAQLDGRLSAILLDHTPLPDDSKAINEECLVPMANNIQRQRRIIESHNTAIRDILERLEI
jgi:hypothetical protein